ncbi:hypothetical protein AB3508_01680 [Acinetobacter baumannii]
MHLDLSLAVEEGMQSSVTRDKSIEEIDNVLFEVDQAVKKATNNKVEFGWRKKGFNTLGLLTGLTSLPITDVKMNLKSLSRVFSMFLQQMTKHKDLI